LQVVRPMLVSTYALVNPVVAVLLGATIGHEPLTPRAVWASIIIVAGIACIILRPRTLATARAAQ
jgi:drug/metabolite transporter (DMT)-like permease